MRVRRILRILLLLALFPLLSCGLCGALYWFVWCHHETFAEVRSPSGSHVTYAQYDDCVGATGWGYTWVGVKTPLSVLGFGDQSVLLVYGKPSVSAEWRDEHTVVIHYTIYTADGQSLRGRNSGPWDGINIILDGPSS